MKNIKILSLLTAALFMFAACSETEEIPEFNNWEERNTQFLDSLAKVAQANKDGDWKIFLDERIPDTTKEWDTDDYVYCKVIKSGDGTTSPFYTDTVSVNYRGRLIPSTSNPAGYIFDSSYDGELEPDFDVPAKLKLSGTVVGFSTAVQQMVTGDIWRVYIPAKLGYGTEKYSEIPGHSILIFDINLVSFTSQERQTN